MKLKVIILLCVLNSISGALIPNLDVEYHESYIVGGTNATDGEAPYQCSMQKKGRHFCGCVIISDQWLLTAAHCIRSADVNSTTIVVGTNDLKLGGVQHQPLQFIEHEMYNDPTRLTHDIGLIQVNKIEFNEKVQPIKLNPTNIPQDTKVQAFGWGRLSTSGPIARFLQTITLTSISKDECKTGMDGVLEIHDSYLCTLIKEGQGVCYGDSGSSLVLDNKLVGIASWIKPPCASGGPNGFARISYLYEWIQSKINQ